MPKVVVLIGAQLGLGGPSFFNSMSRVSSTAPQMKLINSSSILTPVAHKNFSGCMKSQPSGSLENAFGRISLKSTDLGEVTLGFECWYLLCSCVTLGKFISFPEPTFSQLQDGNNKIYPTNCMKSEETRENLTQCRVTEDSLPACPGGPSYSTRGEVCQADGGEGQWSTFPGSGASGREVWQGDFGGSFLTWGPDFFQTSEDPMEMSHLS